MGKYLRKTAVRAGIRLLLSLEGTPRNGWLNAAGRGVPYDPEGVACMKIIARHVFLMLCIAVFLAVSLLPVGAAAVGIDRAADLTQKGVRIG